MSKDYSLEYYTPEPLPDEQKKLDIVERLRSVDVSWSEIGEWCAEAADEIERLRDEVFNLQTEVHFDDQAIKSFQVVNERLREALQKILDLNNFENIFEIASAALKDGE